ncbi:heme o synthase [Desertibaculum subflavum]|uniref:heme o synthase n=1 Tax=Desertibaculum subflavum TaxID=2268458 RepID=UPI000E6748C2
MTDIGLQRETAPFGAVAAGEPAAGDYIALLKPRVMSLVVFTALVGIVVAPGQIHPLIGAVALFFIALGAGASGALNMWWDADIDARMARTASRPVPQGRIAPREALGFGLALAVCAVACLGLLVNLAAAALLAFTIFFYAVIYTIWLKRRTPQNIVIGGAAGAFPPMIGWAAVTGDIGWGAIALFAVIFLWTPPHFWALSLVKAGEYARAGVPMLPVVAGPEETRRQILLYSWILVPATFAPLLAGVGGTAYLAAAGALGVVFLVLAHALHRTSTDRAAMRLFGFSILYLFLLFAVLLGEALVAQL